MSGHATDAKDLLRTRSQVSDSGCWNWMSCVQGNGYGRVRFGGKTEYVHRLSYATFVGTVPVGMDVCHRCDNRRCCNPDHLFLGTREDNMKDAKAKGRLSIGDKHGEKLCGEKGPGSKLNLRQVKAIRRCLAEGQTVSQLASAYGVSKDNIRRINRGDTWKEESKCAA